MIAVIIPVYNRADRLRRTLDSLVIQTDKRFFTIVVDDCSTEDITSVCNEYLNKLHIRCIRNWTNLGPGQSRQVGINAAARANMEYVMFVDGDDMLYPDAVSKLGYEIKHRMDDMVVSGISVQKKIGYSFTISAESGSTTWLHGKIFRTKFLTENGITFPTALRGNEDVAFCSKCFYSTEKKSMLDSNTYLWMDENDSVTRMKGEARNNILSIDYVEANYDVFRYFNDKKDDKTIFKLFPRLFYCYNYYQTYYSLSNEVPARIDDYITYIISIPVVQKELLSSDSLNELKNNIQQYVVIDKKIIPFKESFFDWIKRHGGNVLND